MQFLQSNHLHFENFHYTNNNNTNISHAQNTEKLPEIHC